MFWPIYAFSPLGGIATVATVTYLYGLPPLPGLKCNQTQTQLVVIYFQNFI